MIEQSTIDDKLHELLAAHCRDINGNMKLPGSIISGMTEQEYQYGLAHGYFGGNSGHVTLSVAGYSSL